MSGDHSRHPPGARSASTVATANVAAATEVPAAGSTPAGTSLTWPIAIGMTVTAISMSDVPETIGVMIRRSNGSHAVSANWNSDEMTIRLASMESPPSVSATTETAMNGAPAPVVSTCPAPNRPTRPACRAVTTPLIIRAAKTAHDR